MIVFVLLTLLPAGLLAAGTFRWLTGRGFGPFDAGLLTLAALAQAGPAMALVRPGATLWPALGVAALAANASAFAEREDLRRVILLGASLALIQFCSPSGMIVAAGMLPATFALGTPRAFGQAAGFYVSLLFLPLCAGLLSLVFAREGYALVLPAGIARAGWQTLHARLLLALAPAAITAPGLCLARRTGAGRAVGLVTGAVVFAAGLAAFTGTIYPPAAILSAAAPLSMLALAALTPERRGRIHAASLAAFTLSWAAFVLARF